MKRFLQTRAWILCGPWPAEQREKGKVTFLGRVIVKGNVPPCPRRLQALLDPLKKGVRRRRYCRRAQGVFVGLSVLFVHKQNRPLGPFGENHVKNHKARNDCRAQTFHLGSTWLRSPREPSPRRGASAVPLQAASVVAQVAACAFGISIRSRR